MLVIVRFHSRFTIRPHFPIPPDNREEEGLGVLPIVRYSGRYRTIDRTFELEFSLPH
jgi:hypothetical protein